MTEHEAYMKGVSFAARAWENSATLSTDISESASAQAFTEGYLDATLWLFAGKTNLNMALRKGRSRNGSPAFVVKIAS